jgi:superfamily II DNA or RNA helicase
MNVSADVFPVKKFRGQLRPSQQAVVEIAKQKLQAGHKKLHIVAPPGSGKTVLGLYLWGECIRLPAVVLAPNSAIQSQWASKCDLFEFITPREQAVSLDPKNPAVLTSLTYQSLTLPGSTNDTLEEQAFTLWIEKLIATEQALNADEALVWVEDLRRHNQNYYEERLATYRKQARDMLTSGGESLATLHSSVLGLLQRLKERQVGLIIFDECHHLLGHWGRVLNDVAAWLGNPILIGLTATPPDTEGKPESDVERYAQFFGEIDFEVPVPAVVKDGFLAPYQDLVYFVRPTGDELAFVARADAELLAIVHELCQPRKPQTAKTTQQSLNLIQWLQTTLAERRLPTGVVKDWSSFAKRDTDFAQAARLFLLRRGEKLPENVPLPDFLSELSQAPELDILTPVLDRYVRHYLRRSPNAENHALAETTIARLRMLGMQITETGCRPCASPVGRVLAYSQAKASALPAILRAEYAVLKDKLRAVVVTDYEKTSAVTAEVKNLLNEEAGGAIAAFKTLLNLPDLRQLDPILVTGSTVLVDNDAAPKVLQAAQHWLTQHKHECELTLHAAGKFQELTGQGRDWCPRVYIAMITQLFQQGIAQCLVGTRGLLGEGWDADKINVLIDLTTVTTSMSVNQLRGRSIRLDPQEKQKLANNWDVVCLAPEFTKGLDDYRRFRAKHATLFGVTDDGTIEKGVGHVHAALTELQPELLEDAVSLLNKEMLQRVTMRSQARALWNIGERFRGEVLHAVEARPLQSRDAGGFPPFHGMNSPWTEGSLMQAMGTAILKTSLELGLITGTASLHVSQRSGGYVRAFLEHASEEESRIFSQACHELLAPLDRPRYAVPRLIHSLNFPWYSQILPQFVKRYFEKREVTGVVLHAVPNAFAKNKEVAVQFQRHWNEHVSPGEVIYTLHGQGESILQQALANKESPQHAVHEKELFR